MALQTEYEFTLPKGFIDEEGTLHKKGVMRLATAADEILPQKDPRVQSNPAYLTLILLSRVVTKLGSLNDVNPSIIEGLFLEDLTYLQALYQRINGMDDDPTKIYQLDKKYHPLPDPTKIYQLIDGKYYPLPDPTKIYQLIDRKYYPLPDPKKLRVGQVSDQS